MIKEKNTFDEGHLLHELKHYLPAQNPLKDFVHHNTLHAFQGYEFHTALTHANRLFGYKTYLPIEDYRHLYTHHAIPDAILDRTIVEQVPNGDRCEWREKVLKKRYDESITPMVGRLRGLWAKHYAINLEKSVHSLLFKLICGYLDQGIAIWPFPIHEHGFMDSLKLLSTNKIVSLFKTPRAERLFYHNATITELLSILVGDPDYYTNYIFDQQFAHPGWSGMVATIEEHPTTLLDYRKITLADIIRLELIAEIDILDRKYGETWRPIGDLASFPPYDIERLVPETEIDIVRAIWQEAYEWSYYDEVLNGISRNAKQEVKTISPETQAIFCMDDRECSLRRHLESVMPTMATYSTAAFFNFEFYYQPIFGKFYTKLCPAPITPKFIIKELPRKTKLKKDYYAHKQSHSLVFGWVISQTLGLAAAVKLFLSIFKPRMTPATTSSFGHLHVDSKLQILHDDKSELIDGLQVGYTPTEMADRVEGLLRSIGLIQHFAHIIYIVGHGATSINNTHFAGYDCGACSGRPSSVNAKVFCYAANHKTVRAILASRGIEIPNNTQFVPALHDTTRDEIKYYDEVMIHRDNAAHHERAKLAFSQALIYNAYERARRFDTIDSSPGRNIHQIHNAVKLRSLSLFEPRPELNHANNALCIVGRRHLSQGLFLDRRSFLNSYDYQVDRDGILLTNILGAVAPVAGGINLEYYFSRVDNHKLGAGTKLPHNVMGLLGVANGIDGDLRTGLPSQMIEIHEPKRLLVIVEQEPEIINKAISSNTKTLEWYRNRWVNLVAIHPEEGSIWQYDGENFVPYQLQKMDVPIISDIHAYVGSTDQSLSIAIINKNK